MFTSRFRFLFLSCFLVSIGFCVFAQGAGIEEKTITAAEKIRKSVVAVRCIRYVRRRVSYDPFWDSFLDEFLGRQYVPDAAQLDVGSGVIVDKDGFILTNEHVISGASKIMVTITGGRQYPAKVAAVDYKNDLALLKISASDDLSPAVLADSSKVKRGQWVIAAGNPFAFAIDNAEPTLTIGIVGALHRSLPYQGWGRTYVDLIQTDAAINPGNSGGPLVDLDGNVIGINVAILSMSGGSVGLGFAIPSNTAKRLLESVRRGEPITYGWIGIYGQDVNERLRRFLGFDRPHGVFVVEVAPGGPADKAGVKEGDVIVRFNGTEIRDMQDLLKYASQAPIGKPAVLDIIRNGIKRSISVIVGKQGEGFIDQSIVKRPSTPVKKHISGAEGSVSFMGMELSQASGKVFVSGVEPGSPADKAGLLKGDVVLKINDTEVYSLSDISDTMAKDGVLVKTQRGYFVLFEE